STRTDRRRLRQIRTHVGARPVRARGSGTWGDLPPARRLGRGAAVGAVPGAAPVAGVLRRAVAGMGQADPRTGAGPGPRGLGDPRLAGPGGQPGTDRGAAPGRGPAGDRA